MFQVLYVGLGVYSDSLSFQPPGQLAQVQHISLASTNGNSLRSLKEALVYAGETRAVCLIDLTGSTFSFHS